jgi:hypothetical protein
METKEELKIDTNSQVLEYLKQGDLVYELYSVLVHSGSAMGGHYYAYIKSFEDSSLIFKELDEKTLSLEAEKVGLDLNKLIEINSNITSLIHLKKQILSKEDGSIFFKTK